MTTWSLMEFRDELDVLDIKLGTLGPVVDKWVISEAEITHAGQPKPLYFDANRKRFESGYDIEYVVDAAPPDGDWGREHHQRQILSAALGEAAPDDLVLISDCDEVPDPRCWPELERIAREGGVGIPRLTMHVLGFRWRWHETWPGGARLVTVQTLRDRYGGDVDRLFETYNEDVGALWAGDGSRFYGPTTAPGAGWHFSHFGGVEGVLAKLSAAAHRQFDAKPFNDPIHIEQCIQSGDDLLGRPERQQEPAPKSDLPPYVLKHWERFEHLW